MRVGNDASEEEWGWGLTIMNGVWSLEGCIIPGTYNRVIYM